MNKYEEKILEKCEEGTYFITPYIKAKQSLVLSCINNHHRSIIPSNLISKNNGTICKVCLGDNLPGKKSHTNFLLEVKNKYEGLNVIGTYTGAKVPVLVGCSKGHTWEVLPSNLLSRTSDAICTICNPIEYSRRLTIQDINSRLQVHYPYLTVIKYINSSSKSTVLDARCGNESEAFINNLMEGRAWKCVHCEPHLVGTSAMEQNLLRFIRSIYDGWIIERDTKMIAPKELDIVIPDIGLCIEFDGIYYHSKDKNYHINKTIAVEDYEYQLIHIFDCEWIKKRAIVESRLRNLIGKSKKIYARKCEVRDISWPISFLENNHIQGAGSPSSKNYGLFLDGELVAVMTFSKSKFSNIAEYELVRYCSILNTIVVGGASKLLAKFRKDNNVSILSYSDKRWSKGNLYKQLGFILDHTSDPGYKWYKNNNSLSRYQTVKAKLPLLFPNIYIDGMTEEQCMVAAGYNKVYDCGNDVWVLK